MKKLIVALAACASLQPCFAQELTGTPYSVLWRGAGYAPTQGYGRQLPQQQSGLTLRLVDVAARREVSRAVFDNRLGGWIFQMPFAGMEPRNGICLALVDARNQYVPVRQASAMDPGSSFRNPLWDRELARVGELADLKKEFAAVDAQARSAGGEIARLSAEAGLPPGANPAQCLTPPPAAEPPRPPGALEPAQAAAESGALCAWRWERDHGSRVNLTRIFADAGLEAEWRDRGGASAVAENLAELRVPIGGGDLALVLDAATKGRTFMEHADGVRMLARAQTACRAEVGRQTAAVRQRWLDGVRDAQMAPERSRQQCVQKLEQMAKLQVAQSAAPSFLEVLARKIAQLSSPYAGADGMPLQTQLCQP